MPKGTTHVGVTTSFSGCTLKINDVIGNMSVVELSTAKNAVKVTLHESDNGESKATYEIHVDVSEEEAQGREVVMKEKDVPEDQKVHAHSHDGVPCTKDHSKDGEEHGHGHDHGHKEHGHSHDMRRCIKTTQKNVVRKNTITDIRIIATATVTAMRRRRRGTRSQTLVRLGFFVS